MRFNAFSVVTIAVLAVLAILACFTVLPWVIMFFGLSALPDPPKPKITHAEFPLRLEYVINGEKKVIEDTLICDYDGAGMDEGNGKYRTWKEHLASGEDNLLLLKSDGASGIANGDKKTTDQAIYFDPGPAWYYMGDTKHGKGYYPTYPGASFSEKYQDGSGANGTILADELLAKYKIQLTSWNAPPPIVNHFSTAEK